MPPPTVFDLTGLSATEGFIIQGDGASDLAGFDVSNAGDINGDGFDDVIVGALLGDDGGDGAGEGYVVFGKASGFGTIDLTNLAPADGFIIQGADRGDWAGQSVSSAGDVNGDGFDDVIIGAAGGANKGDFPGNAHVIFGKAAGFSTIDLANLAPADGFTISGDAIGDRLGSSVSSAGDVNGDGFDDIIVGAQSGGDGGYNAGEAYVVFGKAGGVGDVDLSNLASGDGFIIQGDAAGDAAGRNVSSAGDVNGDGFDDLIVGAVAGDDGGYNAGEAYVVFGKASGFSTIDLTGFAPTDGFIIQGDVAGDLVGQSVSSAGDVNGDGFDDLIVGAYGGDDGGNGAGEAYVVFGKASGFGTIDLSSLAPAEGFIIQGDAAGDSAGQSVSSAGDVNGDGYDDLIVGSAYGDDAGDGAGEAYVVFGKASGFGTIDLSNLAPADGFIIQGDEAGDRAGSSVSKAGDVNGDGYDDLIVGAPRGNDGAPSAGEAYVIFGGAFGGDGTSVNTTGTAAADILIGGLGDDSLAGGGGADVIRAGAGDDLLTISDTGFGRIDGGTGFDSLVLDGANLDLDLTQILPAEIDSIETIDLTGSGDNSLSLNQLNVFDITEERSGGTAVLRVTGNAGDSVAFDEIGWVNAGSLTEGADTFDRYVLGNAEVRVEQGVTVEFPSLIDLTGLPADQGFIIQGDAGGDSAGHSVSNAGDVNGDGFDDVIVGAFLGNDGGVGAGEGYVVFGKASGFGTVDLSNLTPSDGFIIQGADRGDGAGQTVSSAGDMNGDGFDDIIIGAAGGANKGDFPGNAHVIFGKASGFSTIDLANPLGSDGFTIQGDAIGDFLGTKVSDAGDINGDGFDDIIVGARRGDNGGYDAGEAYVIFGKGSGFGTIDLSNFALADGFIIQGASPNDGASYGISKAGDLNGDGFDDMIVGATASTGAAVIFGKASGFGNIDLSNVAPADGFLFQSNTAGNAVSTGGDVNGDGFDDLILRAAGNNNAGGAYVVFGKASGLENVDLTNLAPSDGFSIQGDMPWDSAGSSVSTAGDINGDGFDDLIIGAPFGDDGGINAGEAYVIFGKASGFGTIDLANLAPADGFIIQADEAGDRAGRSVSTAGDVNGDGYDDLIVGAPRGDDGGSSAGEAYVIFGGAFGGDGTSVNTTGTAADEVLIGGLGDDSLTGGGGADVIRAGAGDDLLTISDTGFGRIDGGTGFDSLVLDGANLDLDLTQILPAEIDSIETIDLTGSGDNSLSLNQLNVFDITEERSGGTAVLRVTGNAGDSVAFDEIGWVNAGSITEGADTFDRYVLGNAEVRVEQGVTVAFPSLIDLTGLPADQGFVIQGDASGDLAGRSVSSAGDINGDGFDDIIVGADHGDDGADGAGEGYVIFGKASGFGTVDLSNLTPSDGFIIQGADRGDWAGQAVSSAGDMNGDGFDDIIIGAAGGAEKGDFPGNAHVIFGKTSGFGTIDLAALAPADGFTIQGDAIGDRLGTSVSDAGDINGDGFDDIIIGARGGSNGGYSAGEAYVLFGKASGFGTVDLSNFAPADGFIIQGASPNDNAGYSVAKAGDLNGDGFDDMIVGATTSTGAAVIFGRASGFGNIDLANVAPADGFLFQSNAAGSIVSSAGDVNGDGFDDLILAASRNDDGGVNAGGAYVIFGKASGLESVDIASLAPTEGFFIQGDTVGDFAGDSVATAGDVNGDGFDDLIIGAPFGDDGGINAGEAYVIFGKASGFGTIDLSNLAPADGFIIQGDEAGDRAGRSVSTAGDVNGDGYDDLIVGAPRGNDGAPSAGEAYVIFGGAFGGDGTSVNTTGTAADEVLIGGLGDDSLTGGGGADVIRAGAGDDLLTISDTGFGRIDGGTGFDSLVLDGANLDLDLTQILPAEIDSIETIDLTGSGDNSLSLNQLNVFDITEERSGGTAVLRVTGNAGDSVAFDEIGWVNAGSLTEGADTFDRYVLGNAEVRVEQGVTVEFPSLIDLTGLPADQGFIIQGDAGGDSAGHSVSNAGDVNGDGFDDVIVGAFLGNDGGVGAGEGYVVFGKASGFGTVDLSNLTPSDGFIIQGADRGDGAGQTVSSAGDMNGDGFDDIIIGAAGGANKGDFPGNAHVIFGKASGFSTIDLANPLGSDGFTIQGDAIGDFLGTKVSDAGDINGDGFDDIIVGARRGDNGGYDAGEAYVIFGKGSGFGTIDLSNFAPADGFIIQGASPNDGASYGISKAGDLNGDGFDDMIVGATTSTGAAVIFGRASGFGNIDLANVAPADGFLFQSNAAGSIVSSAGDVNGDGFDDLILAASRNDDGGVNAGGAYVIFGKASGLESVDIASLAPTEGFFIQGDTVGDFAGDSVATAGDVNGDGFDDLIIGAPYGDDAGDGAGEAYVVFGKASGFGTIDLSNLAPADGFIIQGDEAGDRAGSSVSTAGDVNGDGYDDLIVGAPRGDDGGSSAGEAYVIFGGAFGGDGTSVNTTGTAADEVLIGGLGDDSLTGGGGADVIRAGAGDDLLTISDTGFGRIDGGNGLDTLVVDGGNIDLDFTLIDSSSKVTGIEAINLTGSGDNSVALGIQDLLQLSDETSDLLVFGDSGDAVTLSGDFASAGSEVVNGASYDVYASAATDARLLAESDITIILDTI